VKTETDAPRALFTVAQFAERYPAWTQAALRNLILNAAERLNSRGERVGGNGLAEVGAIVRDRSRVLIDEAAFFRWLAEQQRRFRLAEGSRTHFSAKAREAA
jgi:hypothetical protein